MLMFPISERRKNIGYIDIGVSQKKENWSGFKYQAKSCHRIFYVRTEIWCF